MNPEMLSGTLTFRRKVLKMAGASVSVYDSSGQMQLFVNQKAFKLKEDIRIYSDEGKTDERLLIMARQIIDFSAAYDVIDSATKEKVGALRRKGWSSMVRDEWEFLDTADNPFGLIQEDSMAMALVRRFMTNLIPQSYDFRVNGASVATLKQHFNPFVFKADMNFLPDGIRQLDPRLAIAAAVLLMTIERQD